MLKEDNTPARHLGTDHQHGHLHKDDKPMYSMEGATTGHFSAGCILWREFDKELALRQLVENQLDCHDPRRADSNKNKVINDVMAQGIRRIIDLSLYNY